MKEDFFFLRIKAGKFMEMADIAFEKGHYDLSALNLEQAVQLFLKYDIGIYLGDFPRTHDISELIETEIVRFAYRTGRTEKKVFQKTGILCRVN